MWEPSFDLILENKRFVRLRRGRRHIAAGRLIFTNEAKLQIRALVVTNLWKGLFSKLYIQAFRTWFYVCHLQHFCGLPFDETWSSFLFFAKLWVSSLLLLKCSIKIVSKFQFQTPPLVHTFPTSRLKLSF